MSWSKSISPVTLTALLAAGCNSLKDADKNASFAFVGHDEKGHPRYDYVQTNTGDGTCKILPAEGDTIPFNEFGFLDVAVAGDHLPQCALYKAPSVLVLNQALLDGIDAEHGSAKVSYSYQTKIDGTLHSAHDNPSITIEFENKHGHAYVQLPGQVPPAIAFINPVTGEIVSTLSREVMNEALNQAPVENTDLMLTGEMPPNDVFKQIQIGDLKGPLVESYRRAFSEGKIPHTQIIDLQGTETDLQKIGQAVQGLNVALQPGWRYGVSQRSGSDTGQAR